MNKFIFLLVVFFAYAGYGQDKVSHEKIKSLKVAFITEQLDLTSKEAEKFWPVYNAHEEKMHDFRGRERHELGRSIKNSQELTEKEADVLITKILELEKQKEKENERYIADVRRILSAKKTLLLIRSEEDFKRRLIKQYRHNHKGD